MSEPEKFLDRWSRRKREAADEPKSDSPAPAGPEEAAEARAQNSPLDDRAKADIPFDPASLPPLESITAESDIRAFLKPGVPPELTRAALRRAWSADPTIRDFIGLVENPWDFNDPHGVPGFGPMPVGEDIGRLLAQAIGAPPAEQTKPSDSLKESCSPGDTPRAAELDQLPKNDSVQRNEDIATQNNSEDADAVPPTRTRGHGGALPK